MLQRTGLNEKEAKVYLALLELGTASAYAIAPKAGLKRPITYIVLESLRQKGLASVIPKAKKTLYQAGAPEKLMQEVRKREELLTRFMPNFDALYNARKEKPAVAMFEGIEGVRAVYKKIFQSESVWFLGTSQEILKIEPSAWEGFLQAAKEKKFKVRDLVMQSEQDKKYIERVQNDTAYENFYEIRVLPKEINIPADSALFGDNLALFAFRPMIFCVMITSKDITQLMRVWYELAWKSSEAA